MYFVWLLCVALAPWGLPNPWRWIIGPIWTLTVVIPFIVRKAKKIQADSRPRQSRAR